MTEPRKERCETCRFWDKGEVLIGRIAYCCRLPPVAVKWEVVDKLNGENPHGVWPVTYDVHWCGEWQASCHPAGKRVLLASLRNDKSEPVRRWVMIMAYQYPAVQYVDEVTDLHVTEFGTFQRKSRQKIRTLLAQHGAIIDPETE